MIAPLVAPVVGIAEDSGRDHAECGSLAVTAVLRTRFPNVALPAIDNSTAFMLQEAVLRACPGAHSKVSQGNLLDVVAANPGCYVVGLVYCTGEAVPCPPPGRAAHWIALYSPAASYYQCWTATLQSISPAALEAASHGSGPHLVIWFASAPALEEDDPVFVRIPAASVMPAPEAEWVTVPGLTTGMSINIAAFADGAVSVQVWAYDPQGKPLGEKTVVLQGNDPGVRGPVQVDGFVYEVVGGGEQAEPCTLVLQPTTVPYSLLVH